MTGGHFFFFFSFFLTLCVEPREVVVGHPLDTTKVRMQSAGGNVGAWRVLVDGLRAGNLYAGAASPLLGAMVHNAVLFYVNGASRAALSARHPIPLPSNVYNKYGVQVRNEEEALVCAMQTSF